MEGLPIFLAAGLLFFLAFANGANDVSKGIATLAGAGLASVRGAVAWGTFWTVVGAFSGLLWGSMIIENVSSSLYAQAPAFHLPAALAAACAPILWVGLATWRKWPVSTTHAIIGAMMGVGLFTLGMQGINWGAFLSKIALPMLASPFMAIALAWPLSPALERLASVTHRIRLCLTPVPKLALLPASGRAAVPLDDCLVCACDSTQAGLTHGVSVSIDHMHWLTSGLLSFSRGLNDTPKLIAVVLPFLLLGDYAAPAWMFVVGALAVGLGSWMAGGSITRVLGFKVTEMNHERGFSANLIAAFLVIGASRFGLPVSTTHVSSSAIMGVGLANKASLNIETIKSMLFAWLVTAPAAGLFATVIYLGTMAIL
ncbi:MAG: inorganic phosphate transporter [Bdellovibrionales bacterium]